MVPTHELAIQITEVFDKLGKYTDVTTLGIYGVSNVVAGGAINPGAKVMSDNTGKAIAASSTGFALGKHIGLVAAASGDIIPVLLGSNGHFALS
jgi:ATP-dependent RNA helicase RhlE